MSKTLIFDSQIIDVQETTNPLLSRVKIRIAYWGLNRNNSHIAKSVFIDALPTIYNCPIVGEYSRSKEDFIDHGGKVEVTEQGDKVTVEYVQTTIPYGVINDKTEISWEILPDENGVDREYLCATGYIWTGRYKELESVVEDSKGQSMEIEIVESEFIDIDGNKVEDIKKFIFSGFCMLGDDVEPCFEDANIAAFSIEEAKEHFRKEFRKMVYELKEHLSSESNLDVDDKNKIEKGGDEVNSKNKNFSFTSEQLEDELRLALSKIEIDDYGWTYSRYWFQDYMPDKNIVLAWDYNNCYVVGMVYAVEGDAVSIDLSTTKRYKTGEWVEMDLPVDTDSNESIVTNFANALQAKEVERAEVQKQVDEYKQKFQNSEVKFDQLNEDHVSLKQEHENITKEFEKVSDQIVEVTSTLEKFKKDKNESEETALFERFAEQFTEEEFTAAKESMVNMSLEQKEEKLFALLGKKNAKFSKKTDGGLLGVKHFNKDNKEDPYGGLLSEE